MGGKRISPEIVARIIEMRENGATHKEIADKTALNVRSVSYQLKKIGFKGPTEHGRALSREAAIRGGKAAHASGRQCGHLKPKKTDDEIVQTVSLWDDRWEYVSGYVNCDSVITIRCKTCGCEIQQSFVTIRKKGSSKKCRSCTEREKQLERARREEKRLEEKRIAFERKNTHICKECGKLYVASSHPVYCSEQCRQKSINKHASRRKDKRLNKSRDLLLTWKDIYKKTKDLTCAGCGQICDTQDFTVREDGTIVCGDLYPSIDHIVPVAKGGRDEWSNVQIMCRRCNYLKADKRIPPYSGK